MATTSAAAITRKMDAVPDDGAGPIGEAGEVEPIELDERSHPEVLMLYRESSETVRFAKSLMWKCVGATLLIQLSLVAVAYVAKSPPVVARIGVGVGILVVCGAIYSLVIYQSWQSTERAKLTAMATLLSEPLQRIRAIQSPRESNFHRYTLLTFMIVLLVIGQIVATVALSPLYG